MANKAELLDFLDKHFFHRILNASERDLGTRQKEDLQDLKRRAEENKARYHGYDSADRLVAAFREDSHADSAKAENARLIDLHLPRLVDLASEFLRVAGDGGQPS